MLSRAQGYPLSLCCTIISIFCFVAGGCLLLSRVQAYSRALCCTHTPVCISLSFRCCFVVDSAGSSLQLCHCLTLLAVLDCLHYPLVLSCDFCCYPLSWASVVAVLLPCLLSLYIDLCFLCYFEHVFSASSLL